MKNTMDQYSFVSEFQKVQDRRDSQNFSRAGLFALYDYLTQYEEEIGTDLEFDPIALCCEYSEYDTAWEAMEQYQPDDMPTVDLEAMTDADGVGPDLGEVQEEQEKLALEWLHDNTQVIEFDGGVIILDF